MLCTLCSCQMFDTIHFFRILDMSVFVVPQSLALSGPLWYLTYLRNLGMSSRVHGVPGSGFRFQATLHTTFLHHSFFCASAYGTGRKCP